MAAQTAKPVIGLTGGIGSGKSLVAGQFARLGCVVIDADELARTTLAKPEVVRELINWWGQAIADEEGRVDRRAVSRIVFHDPEQLRRLENLTHPHVYRARTALRRRHQMNANVSAIVEDCPLLVEVGLDKECDVIIFVDSPRQLRLARLAVSRGWTEQDLARREKNQLPLDKKAEFVDYVIVNNAGEAECFTHVRGVYSQILQK